MGLNRQKSVTTQLILLLNKLLPKRDEMYAYCLMRIKESEEEEIKFRKENSNLYK